jgi:hypothetical protein
MMRQAQLLQSRAARDENASVRDQRSLAAIVD